MIKIKYILLIVCLAGCFAACKKTENTNDGASQAAQLTADTTAIRKFIVANNIPAIKDKSGVFYQIIAPGTGSVVYTANTTITANYAGRLLNGTVFDTNLSSTGAVVTPFSFTLPNVIVGWQVGIPYIQNGGQIRLIIPSLYGYGSTAVGTIPANSILDFTITLTNVQN
ncbi:FKBP-type peptidyl-prolyl cis-trans isomerase [Pedobacter sp. L105]|uniref:FKBP-type peptidyl-prolyl cis-trans isomerase n=1 Tax=Pedobacter sp. L105 TaxID=1641871 RepID=UPI00131B2602|nr:FKBP-type peptidyl-prolyl cis-trans isomerase [Pedobacter sp. L105]